MQRIMIIGGPGSGKSTVAQRVGAALNVPVFHMDREVFWLPGWEERDKASQVAQVERIVAQDAWVFEGNNTSTFHLRAPRADALIWLDLPLPLRLWRVVRRNWVGRGQTRPDMGDDCPERVQMLPGFVWYILRTTQRSRQKSARLYASFDKRKHHLTSRHAVAQFVEAL